MKSYLIILACGLSLTGRASDYLPVKYDGNGFFHLNSGQSEYVGYRPDTYQATQPISLLVWLHGCGGKAEGDLWSVAPPHNPPHTTLHCDFARWPRGRLLVRESRRTESVGRPGGCFQTLQY